MPFQVKSSDGRTMIVRIAEVKNDTVIIDFNHPLAGKTLTFQIKVVSVK
jgi:FKBP-type peptidyl-prolyl cis-trans isomerase SlyD